MGVDHSFVAVFDRADTDRMLPALAAIAGARTAERLAGLTWASDPQAPRQLWGDEPPADRGIAGLVPGDWESPNSYCFNLRFELEPELRSLWHKPDAPQPMDFGCMWTSVTAGEAYVRLSAMAATTRMSRIMERSASLRALWRAFGSASGARFAGIEMDGSGHVVEFWPGQGPLTDDPEALWQEGESVDATCSRWLELSRALPAGRSCGSVPSDVDAHQRLLLEVVRGLEERFDKS